MSLEILKDDSGSGEFHAACPDCDGGIAEVTCWSCNGTGDAMSSMTVVGICQRCDGGMIRQECETCNGEGEIEVNEYGEPV